MGGTKERRRPDDSKVSSQGTEWRTEMSGGHTRITNELLSLALGAMSSWPWKSRRSWRCQPGVWGRGFKGPLQVRGEGIRRVYEKTTGSRTGCLEGGEKRRLLGGREVCGRSRRTRNAVPGLHSHKKLENKQVVRSSVTESPGDGPTIEVSLFRMVSHG